MAAAPRAVLPAILEFLVTVVPGALLDILLRAMLAAILEILVANVPGAVADVLLKSCIG